MSIMTIRIIDIKVDVRLYNFICDGKRLGL